MFKLSLSLLALGFMSAAHANDTQSVNTQKLAEKMVAIQIEECNSQDSGLDRFLNEGFNKTLPSLICLNDFRTYTLLRISNNYRLLSDSKKFDYGFSDQSNSEIASAYYQDAVTYKKMYNSLKRLKLEGDMYTADLNTKGLATIYKRLIQSEIDLSAYRRR